MEVNLPIHLQAFLAPASVWAFVALVHHASNPSLESTGMPSTYVWFLLFQTPSLDIKSVSGFGCFVVGGCPSCGCCSHPAAMSACQAVSVGGFVAVVGAAVPACVCASVRMCVCVCVCIACVCLVVRTCTTRSELSVSTTIVVALRIPSAPLRDNVFVLSLDPLMLTIGLFGLGVIAVSCLDAKVNFDSNAEFRHSDIFSMHDDSNIGPPILLFASVYLWTSSITTHRTTLSLTEGRTTNYTRHSSLTHSRCNIPELDFVMCPLLCRMIRGRRRPNSLTSTTSVWKKTLAVWVSVPWYSTEH